MVYKTYCRLSSNNGLLIPAKIADSEWFWSVVDLLGVQSGDVVGAMDFCLRVFRADDGRSASF